MTSLAAEQIEIVPFDESRIDDWLDFFDHRAFCDHREWKTCYCTFYHYPKSEAYKNASSKKRDYAIWLIKNGILKGFLAYRNGKVIGFCNVNRRENYSRLAKLHTTEEQVLSIVCFVIQKEERRKGLATILLKEIIKSAEENGFDVIEAYPGNSENEFGNFHGPLGLFRKFDFVEEKTGNRFRVRKHTGKES